MVVAAFTLPLVPLAGDGGGGGLHVVSDGILALRLFR